VLSLMQTKEHTKKLFPSYRISQYGLRMLVEMSKVSSPIQAPASECLGGWCFRRNSDSSTNVDSGHLMISPAGWDSISAGVLSNQDILCYPITCCN
jgi:hypothetical protein